MRSGKEAYSYVTTCSRLKLRDGIYPRVIGALFFLYAVADKLATQRSKLDSQSVART